ncbi:MAG TPA: monomethylamine:corrinoid methyltransferase [Thermofilaceae archaeon]|nr:monomethylamine:corrinoid methyltransferase [Thermofilaceae archaeon]
MKPLDVERRAKLGPYLSSKKFDLELSKRIAELEREYGVAYDPDDPVPDDPSLARSVFEAGRRLLLEVGIYVVDAGRVARVGEDELAESLEHLKSELKLGEGADARILRARSPGSRKRPFVFGGYAGTPTPEEVYEASALSYASEPLVDALDHGSLSSVGGVDVARGAPSEALATIREVQLLFSALRRAGRRGMHLLTCESSVSGVGSLAAMSIGVLRRGDAQLIPILNELKTDYAQLVKAELGIRYGLRNAALVDPVVGGFARGAAGTAICAVAEALAAVVAYRSEYILIHPYHIRLKATSVRECLWVECVVGQAGQYLSAPLIGDVWPANGGGVTEMLYEIAANTIVATTSGLNLLGPAPANGEKPNGTGLEARFMAEVGLAVTGARPREVCGMVVELIEKYEHKLKSPEDGLPFTQLYDVTKGRPVSWWYEKYVMVKEELADYGLPLQ